MLVHRSHLMVNRIRRLKSHGSGSSIVPEEEDEGLAMHPASSLSLDREALKERLWIERRMMNSTARLMHFFLLLFGYLFCLSTHQPIQMLSQVHRRLSKHYGLTDMDELESLDDIEKVMSFLQLFAQRTYDLAAAIIDVTTLDTIDGARCFWGLRNMDKACKVKYWEMPLRFPQNPNFVDVQPLIWDRIGRSNLDSVKVCPNSSDRAHDDRCIDGRDVPLGQVDPQYGRVFGLTPEYPIIFDATGDFPGSSHAVLMPVVWQVRSPSVPCAHFHKQYNDDIMGAGKCRPDEPCTAKSVPAFSGRERHWESNRTINYYLTYGAELMKCVDRSKHTSTFYDKSYDPWATFSDMRNGAEKHSQTLLHGRPVFFKFFSDIAFLQAPVPESIYINVRGTAESCDLRDYDLIPSECAAPLLDPMHPMWAEASSGIYWNRTSLRSLFNVAYFEGEPGMRRNTFFTRETSELTVASFIITPQSEAYREIVTIVRVTFSVSQGGEITVKPTLFSTSRCMTWWYVAVCVELGVSVCYMCNDVRTFLKMRRDIVNRLFAQRLAIYMDLVLPLLVVITLVWMVILDEVSGGGRLESFLANTFASASERGYFNVIMQLVDHQESVVWLNKFGFFVGIFQILRLVLYFGMHPRLAVLVDTVCYAADEMWHFTIVFCMLYVVMGLLAYWMFGQESELFSSPSQALWTQLGMFIGEYGYALPMDTPDVAFIIYQLVFIFMVFLVLLNFFLAIVVEAYSEVRKAIEECKVEDELVQDLVDVAYTLLMQHWQRWPAGNEVYHGLLDHQDNTSSCPKPPSTASSSQPFRRVVDADFLYENVVGKKGIRLFKSRAHAAEYVDFYAEKMEKYGDFVVRPVLEPMFVVPDVPESSPALIKVGILDNPRRSQEAATFSTLKDPVQELRSREGLADRTNSGAAADSLQALCTELETDEVPFTGALDGAHGTTRPKSPRGDAGAPSSGRTQRMVEMLRAHGDELMRAAERIEELESENKTLRKELETCRPKPAILTHVAECDDAFGL